MPNACTPKLREVTTPPVEAVDDKSRCDAPDDGSECRQADSPTGGYGPDRGRQKCELMSKKPDLRSQGEREWDRGREEGAGAQHCREAKFCDPIRRRRGGVGGPIDA